MADNPIEALVRQLSQQAGPRGFTFAGRASKPGESLESIMQRVPQGELETGGALSEVLKAGIPLAMWKGMLPEAKATITQYANRFPQKFKQILDHPQDLFLDVTDLGNPKFAGTFENYGNQGGKITIGPRHTTTTTPTHEIQHYLDTQRVLNTDPVDAETIGGLLHEIIPNIDPWDQGSLHNTMNRLRGLGTQRGFAGTLREAVSQGRGAWDELDFLKNSKAGQLVTSNYTPQGKLGTSDITDAARLLAMDEGLAYLAEHATNPNSDSLLKLLAARLNVLPE